MLISKNYGASIGTCRLLLLNSYNYNTCRAFSLSGTRRRTCSASSSSSTTPHGDENYRMNNIPSEGRLSIRESIRLFNQIEEALHVTENSPSFEQLGRLSMKSIFPSRTLPLPVFEGVSCGSTRNIFAAIFLAKSQLNDVSISNLTQGSNIMQLMNNPNIPLHVFRRALCSDHQHLQSDCSQITNNIGYQISRSRARTNLSDFTLRLMEQHEEKEFPLVFFCSMAWTYPSSSIISTIHTTAKLSTSEVSDETAEHEDDIADHVFTIIKNSNDNFQIVQGYVEKFCMHNKDEAHSSGMELHDWRSSNSPYSDRKGFSRLIMHQFISKMDRFVEDGLFDSDNHEEMFGVSLQRNQEHYWPSISFTELEDHDIIGCGERDMIEHMHTLCEQKHI